MKKKKVSKLVYLDTSIFAGKVLLADAEDKKCALLIKRIREKKFANYEFITSIFTLIELAELISRKRTKNKAKAILFDIMYDPDLQISLITPEKPHKTWKNKVFFDIEVLIAHLVDTAMECRIPGFDTIHAHTVKKLDEKVIVVSKDKHFDRFKQLKNVIDIVTASNFLAKKDVYLAAEKLGEKLGEKAIELFDLKPKKTK